MEQQVLRMAYPVAARSQPFWLNPTFSTEMVDSRIFAQNGLREAHGFLILRRRQTASAAPLSLCRKNLRFPARPN